MNRYKCAKGKYTNVSKANKVCLIKRCPYLKVLSFMFGKPKYT
jgi:hypothetical protein